MNKKLKEDTVAQYKNKANERTFRDNQERLQELCNFFDHHRPMCKWKLKTVKLSKQTKRKRV